MMSTSLWKASPAEFNRAVVVCDGVVSRIVMVCGYASIPE